MNKNPFDLIQGILNGKIIYLRPVQFDSSDYDKEFRKSDGQLIKPTMAATTCPQCSCVIEHSIPIDFKLHDDPLRINCNRCNPTSNINFFPFDDPIQSLKLSIVNINPNAASDSRVAVKCQNVLKEKQTELNPIDKLFKPTKPMGLGEFIQSKAAWNKLKQQLDVGVNKITDIFDVFANVPDDNSTKNM